MDLQASVLAALAAAALFAAAVVLQHRAAHRAVARRSARFMAHLAVRPEWLLGMLASAAAVLVYMLALHRGPLVIVQPLLVCGLVFALPLAVLVERRRPDGREWAWAGVVVAGLVIFLLSVRPARGADLPGVTQLLLPTAGLVAVLAVVVLLAYGPVKQHRPTLLGIAAGTGFGLNGGLLKYAIALGALDVAALLRSWPLYAVVLLGAGTIVLSQRAYQAGPLAAGLPGMYIAEALVAILFGAAAFGETPSTLPVLLALQVVGLVVLSVGIVYLARCTPDARLVEHLADDGPRASGTRGTRRLPHPGG